MDNKNTTLTVEIQYQPSGEWFEIWETKQNNIRLAWDEMDDKPTEGGCLRFKDSCNQYYMVVNGGF